MTTFKKSDTVDAYDDGGSKRYEGERDLDRDNDGIACEKR
ncbi:excalibur calcium-binding domain-containing protein [Desertihabitans aurantiacus]|nr:excalibur calcium-binding domain-containing protein [Desertihabitans aurantiacus]